jgi:hypothetical protein
MNSCRSFEEVCISLFESAANSSLFENGFDVGSSACLLWFPVFEFDRDSSAVVLVSVSDALAGSFQLSEVPVKNLCLEGVLW